MLKIKNLLLLSCLFTAFVSVNAKVEDKSVDLSPELRSVLMKGYDDTRCQEQDFDCCGSTRLNVDSLCARRIETKCEDACRINAKLACIKHLAAHEICTKDLDVECKANVKDLCAKDIKADCACIRWLGAENVCAQSLRATDFLACGKYQATAVFAANTTYNLGANIDFDTILDDPNNNINLAPFYYTAPISGQYIVTVQIDEDTLVSADPVLGIPVAQLHVYRNGTLSKSTFAPFLSFHEQQQTTVAALIHLNAGDRVHSVYEVGVMNDTLGFTTLVGTVSILGNGTEDGTSLFKINLLSADCFGEPICYPCDPYCEPADDCCFQYCQPCCEPRAPKAAQPAPRFQSPAAKK